MSNITDMACSQPCLYVNSKQYSNYGGHLPCFDAALASKMMTSEWQYLFQLTQVCSDDESRGWLA